jgi:hypothetical protein
MSWEIFRCNTGGNGDDCTNPLTTNCISEALYKGQADAMVANGFSTAGYASIHMDDWCVRGAGGQRRRKEPSRARYYRPYTPSHTPFPHHPFPLPPPRVLCPQLGAEEPPA